MPYSTCNLVVIVIRSLGFSVSLMVSRDSNAPVGTVLFCQFRSYCRIDVKLIIPYQCEIYIRSMVTLYTLRCAYTIIFLTMHTHYLPNTINYASYLSYLWLSLPTGI